MNPNEEKIRQYLKKNIQVDVNKQPTQEEKKEFIKRKLFTEQPHQETFQKRSFLQFMRQAVSNGYGFFRTRNFRMFMRDTFPFLAFLTFSTWIIYKMELQFDKMNQSVFKVKTLKEQQIESENEALRGDKYSAQANQITDIPDSRKKQYLSNNEKVYYEYLQIINLKYKFEELDDEDSMEFDTREDFLEGLRKDYNKGISLSEEYKEQVYEYAQRENKPIGFGIGLSEKDNNSSDDQADIKISNKDKNGVKTIKRRTKKPLNFKEVDEDEELGYEGFGPSTSD